jgi:hypothetical protein
MGHERIGFLPHNKQWKAIADKLSSYGDGKLSVAQIADETLNAVKKTYESMPFDDSVVKAIYFLTTLSYSARQENQINFLNENGYDVDNQMTLFSLMSSAQTYITTDIGSLEVNKIAKDAVMQAVIDYKKNHETSQISFLSEDSGNVWSNAGTGAAFCEMARTFFAAFTERQLKYYIERAAASNIDNYESLQVFSNQLSAQSKSLADHSFEISKLTQSFAAGWYNKNVVNALPSENQVVGFLRMSFGKLREELRREADAK